MLKQRQERGKTAMDNAKTQQSEPLVSIIVPIYNAKEHIARCVESIRKQTYRNLEILLLNDGSEDVSYQVCEMFARVDERIVLIDKANSGVAATRNLGLRRAKGKYLQFVDADDTVQPYATELLVQKAEQTGADLVIAHYNRITQARQPDAEAAAKAAKAAKSGKAPKPQPLRPDKVQTYGFLLEGAMTKDAFAACLMQEPASFYYGVMWNKFYRADLVRAHADIICAEDMDWSEDLYFNLSYIRYAQSFYALSTPIYNYYNNPTSAVHTVLNPVNVVTTRAALFSYYKELYEHLGLYEEYRPQIYKYLVASAEG